MNRERGRPDRGDRATEKFRKLFIGCLSSSVDNDALKAYFEQYGEILDVVVMVDRNTGRSRNFGFVTFPNQECVDAVQAARPHRIDDKEIETQRAIPRDAEHSLENNNVKCCKLFVGGLKPDVTEDQLRDYFADFGVVEKAEVITWRDSGKPRGFAFVTFEDYDSVDKSILHNPHSIASSQSMCKKALSKEDMAKVQNKQQHPPPHASRFDRHMDNFNAFGGGAGGMGGGRAVGFGAGGGMGGGGYNDDFRRGGGAGGYNDDHFGGRGGGGRGFGGGGGGYHDDFIGGGGRGFGSFDNDDFGRGGSFGSQRGFGGGQERFGGAGEGGYRDNFEAGGAGGDHRFSEAMSSMANFGSYGRQNMGGGAMRQERFGGNGGGGGGGGGGPRSGPSFHPYNAGGAYGGERDRIGRDGRGGAF